VFRRSDPSKSTAESESTTVDASDQQSAQGKGRPTPKRRDAEAARKSKITPPKDRKEAKQRMREERSKERKQVDAALKSGDERHYPPRDQGKPKALARNWIDGRRNVAEFLWPVVIAALIGLLIRIPTLQSVSTIVLTVFYVVVTVDTARSLFGLRSALAKHLPGEDRRGVLPYAFARSIQSRRRRRPSPQVDLGWTKQLRHGEVKPN